MKLSQLLFVAVVPFAIALGIGFMSIGVMDTVFAQAPPPATKAGPVSQAAPQPTRYQIPQEYMTLVSGLAAQIRYVQEASQAAQKKVEAQLCADKQIALADCEINWQMGNFGRVQAPPPAMPTAPVAHPSPPVNK